MSLAAHKTPAGKQLDINGLLTAIEPYGDDTTPVAPAQHDVPNEHGVYAQCERIEVKAGKCHAEIRVASTSKGWVFDIGYQLPDRGGGALPSVNSPTYDTRAIAIDRACMQLLEGFDAMPLAKSVSQLKSKVLDLVRNIPPPPLVLSRPLAVDADLQAQVLPIDKVFADQLQVRKAFDPAALADLAASIAEHGIQQPITVRPATVKGQDAYIIVAGERRYRACVQLGRTDITAIVREDLRHASRDKIRALQVIENLQRADLTVIETCEGVTLLAEQMGVSKAAEQLGKDKSWVSRHAGVLELWEKGAALLRDGIITAVDIVHDLHALAEINEAQALNLVSLFRNPPAHRSAPNRQEVRDALARERDYQQRERDFKARQQQLALDEAARRAALPPPPQQTEQAELLAAGDQDADEEEGEERTQAGSDDDAPRKLSDYEARSKHRMEISERAGHEAERLQILVEQALGIERIEETEEQDLLWVLDGEQHDSAPLSVDSRIPWLNAAEFPEFEEVRYQVGFDIDLTAPQVEKLAAILAAGVAALNGTAVKADTTPDVPPEDLAHVRQFMKAHVKPKVGEHIKASWLLETYQAWCSEKRKEALSAQRFAKTVEASGIAKKRTNGGFQYLDITPKAV